MDLYKKVISVLIISLMINLLATTVIFAEEKKALPAKNPLLLLERIQLAAHTLDYSGVFTYQQGEVIQSSLLTHLIDGTGERERVETLDGQAREYLLHNDEVQYLMPESRTILIEKHRSDRFPGILLGSASEINKHYTITVQPGLQRVSGRQCRVIEIKPRDKFRYAHRLCADVACDLLLKTQTLNEDNLVVEQMLFTTLHIGQAVQPLELNSHWVTRDWQVRDVEMQSINLAAQGWRMVLPSGFNIVKQVTRLMRQHEPVSQVLLTDGLATISIFIEHNDSSLNELPQLKKMEQQATNVYQTALAHYRVILLGEVPTITLQRLAESIEYVPLAAYK